MNTLILLLSLSLNYGVPSVPALIITSPAFPSNEFIPSKYTCQGSNINPELIIEGIPDNAKTLVLIMEDPDVAIGTVTVTHWLMWNIPVKNRIEENSAPGIQGKNFKKENKYAGSCPPRGTHHYYFKVYALDIVLSLEAGATKKALQKAMQKHIIASGELVGLYKKVK